MSSRPVGKIGTSYREKSRWISVKNQSDFDIPPFAPCFFLLRGDYKDEEQPIVFPFTGRHKPERAGDLAANPMNYSICVNGPAAIKAKGGYGEVTMDYPCVARVKHFTNRLNDPVKKYDSFQPVYVDLNTTADDKAVAYFSDTGNESYQYRLSQSISFYRTTQFVFQAIGVADEAEDLYWIVPRERPLSGSNSASHFVGTNYSQDLVSEFPFETGTNTQEWAVWDEGGISINLPGTYSLSVYLLVSPGSYLSSQSTTLPTDYQLGFEIESLSDQLASARFIDRTVAVIRQPSHLYRINCDEGYGTCPTMDVFRPPVSTNRSLILTVAATDDWKIPTADGKVKAEPLVRLTASRTVSFGHTGDDITPLYAAVSITRGGFDEFYRQGYYGSWGYWGFYGAGYGFGYGGGAGEYIG